ncbi:unnamed protein product [Effrenium voratum]|uniref:SSD domain-containing protein n=1 Tax=Effrenium voratum TaxID=2562239 RepID=A0AA36MLM2_9DINO|nr:unnamed protein product [Effrenium voratum]
MLPANLSFALQESRRPILCACIGWLVLLLVISIGLASLPFRIETNFESFLVSDVQSSLQLASFNAATSSRSTGLLRRLQASNAKAYSTKDLYVAYNLVSPAGSQGILSTKFLSQMSRLEQSLREYPGFEAFCNQTDAEYHGLCNPGLSFSSYALPTLDITQGSIVPDSMMLDGLGFDPVPIRTAFLVAKEHGLASLFLPTGYDPDVDEGAASLRTLFRFKFVVGSASDKVEDRVAAARAVDAKWADFFEEIVVPALTSPDLLTSTDSLKVWFDGTGFRDYEVSMAVMKDIPLAVGSAVFILCYMLLHTRSVMLAIVGPLLAMLSVPITFIVCGAIFGNTTVNFANFLAVFLAIGFGADVMFVYYDAWAQSADRAEKISNRLAWTYRRAVKASLATTSTTALSFLCNMASVIRALRQFGFFMGLCVLVTWLCITFIYVPTIVIDHVWCRRIRLSGKDNSGNRKSACFGMWAHCLYKLRVPVLCLTVVGVIVCIIFTATSVVVGTSMPGIFPENHNQNTGVQVLSEFEVVSQAFPTTQTEPPRQAQVCKEDNFEDMSGCVMQWCEASFSDYRPPWAGNGTCACRRRLLTGCPSTSGTAPVNIRFVGPSTLSDLQLTVNVADHLLLGQGSANVGLPAGARETMLQAQRPLPQLLQQVWETGDTSLSDMMQVSVDLSRDDPAASCGWNEICFCTGELQCKLASEWETSVNLDLPYTRQMQEVGDATGRSLQLVASDVAISKRMKVRAIFGIVPVITVKLLGERAPEDTWTFNPIFDLSDPWAQRALYFFCKDVPEELQITRKWCWFEDFRLFARQQQGRFPVKAVDWPVISRLFVDTSPSATRGTRYIWLEEESIKGMYYSFELGMSRQDPHDDVLALKEQWDKYTALWNAKSSSTARGAFHVSDQWVNVESSSRLIASTATSLIVLCVLALGCMLIFTHSCVLSVVVVVSTIIVIIILCFFITAVMGWEVGLIEVIAFIYFIGYAVDYTLHMVYKYGSREALAEEDQVWLGPDREYASQRLQRMSFALKTMGSATMGSAITTAGSSLFLVFCTLTIFAKLGAMCFTVTISSIIFALCPLGSYLITFGPVRPGHCGRCSFNPQRFAIGHKSQLADRQE